jgi:hypothetical protein
LRLNKWRVSRAINNVEKVIIFRLMDNRLSKWSMQHLVSRRGLLRSTQICLPARLGHIFLKLLSEFAHHVSTPVHPPQGENIWQKFVNTGQGKLGDRDGAATKIRGTEGECFETFAG